MQGLPTRIAAVAFACAVTVLGSPAARAQTNSQPEQPRVFRARTNELTATVIGVDYKNREVVLQGTNGSMDRFAVSDRIKNFDKVRQGDEVKIKYYESVAYAVVKPGELTATSRTDALAIPQDAKKPGGGSISVSNTTATIQAIDRDSRQVTLKGANGQTAHVYVDPSVGNLQRIKEGDQVSITMTKAIAVSVETPGDNSSTTNSPSQ